MRHLRYLVLTLMLAVLAVPLAARAAPPNAYLQGGNSFGTDAVLGTNDNFPLTLQVGGVPRVTLNPFGPVSINGDLELTTDAANIYFDSINGNRSTISYEGAEEGLVLTAEGTGTNINYPQLIVKNGGGVGIGTAWPQGTLHVYDTTKSSLYVGGLEAPDSPPSQISQGCLVMGDSDGVGVTYITANDGVLTASTTKPT